MSQTAFTSSPHTTSTTSNLATDLKPAGQSSSSVKPCCVCKDEKAARDECMLFSKSNDPAQDCEGMVEKYRSCMRGYGFQTN